MKTKSKSELAVRKTKEAYSKIYQQYASNNKNLNTDVRKMLDEFTKRLRGKLVLDVGCASGRETKYLQGKGLNVTGIDISLEFIEIARKECPKCKFVIGDMRHLEFEVESFDGLWASASFLHIPKSDAKGTLSGFWKVLKPGGLLYISVMEGEFEGLRENKQMK